MNFRSRTTHQFAQPPTEITTDKAELGAAVRLPRSARIAFPASNEGLDHNGLTGRHPLNFRPHLRNDASDLVTCHLWVDGIRVLTLIDVEISRANPGRAR